MSEGNGHWEWYEEVDPTKYFGFTYRITVPDGRMYIGKKQFFSVRRVQVPNKKNRRVVRKETDWRKYTSSSKDINLLLKTEKKQFFRFEIIHLWETKGGLVYGEAKAQWDVNVLTARGKDGERLYLNGQIAGIKWIPKEF